MVSSGVGNAEMAGIGAVGKRRLMNSLLDTSSIPFGYLAVYPTDTLLYIHWIPEAIPNGYSASVLSPP